MNLKKTALASAITLALSGAVYAETSTVDGAFILDKTTVGAGEFINLALLGLDGTGKVDKFGERKGAIIIAVVSSEKGVVIGGDKNPGELPSEDVAGGNFSATVKYVKLDQGLGRVHIWYPPDTDTTEPDIVEVILQERTANPAGGVIFNEIARTTKRINVVHAESSNPVSLNIVGFKAAPLDLERGMTDCVGLGGRNDLCEDALRPAPEAPPIPGANDGIRGAMTAGVGGAQVVVEAGNPIAAGNVTVKLRKTSNDEMGEACLPDEGCYEFEYPVEMQQGQAVVTIPEGEITKAGPYYIEATFEGFEGDSVDLFYADIVNVLATGVPRSVKLKSIKTTVTKPAANLTFPTSTQVGQGVRVWGVLLDEYGNVTSNNTGGEIKLSVLDANGAFSGTALNLRVPDNGMKTVALQESGPATDSIVGNAPNEIINIGTTSLTATAVDNSGNPIATIDPSTPLQIKVVAEGLRVVPLFSTSQIAGTEFNAFTVEVTDDQGRVKVDPTTNKPIDPGPVTLMSSSGEQITVNRKKEAPYYVQGLFRTAVADGVFVIGDRATNYGQVIVPVRETDPTKTARGMMQAGIAPAAATVVELQNAHGIIQEKVDPGSLTPDNKFVTTLWEASFKMFDDYGNSVTGKQPLTEDDTGTFTVSSSNGMVAYETVEGNLGIPGRVGTATPGKVTVSYESEGGEAFAGEDTIAVTFTKPGLGSDSLMLTSEVEQAHSLANIVSYVEPQQDENGDPLPEKTNILPVNSEIAMTVEVLDEAGNLFTGASEAIVTIQINGLEGDSITPKVSEISWVTVPNRPERVCKDVGGIFDNETAKVDGGLIVGTCREVRENKVTSGQSLNFSKTGSRKVFAINVGPSDGQFSLTFANAGDTSDENKEIRIFHVQKKVAPPDPEVVLTEEQCIGQGDRWANDECRGMPELTKNSVGMAITADGELVDMDVRFTGGTSVDGGDVNASNSAKLSDESEILFVGSIQFSADHDGEDVDIVAIADYQLNPLLAGAAGGGVFSLEEGGIALPFTTVPDLPAFYEDPYTVTTDEDGNIVSKVVEIYQGPFAAPVFAPSTIKVTLGYRLEDGTIIFNPGPIILNLLP